MAYRDPGPHEDKYTLRAMSPKANANGQRAGPYVSDQPTRKELYSLISKLQERVQVLEDHVAELRGAGGVGTGLGAAPPQESTAGAAAAMRSLSLNAQEAGGLQPILESPANVGPRRGDAGQRRLHQKTSPPRRARATSAAVPGRSASPGFSFSVSPYGSAPAGSHSEEDTTGHSDASDTGSVGSRSSRGSRGGVFHTRTSSGASTGSRNGGRPKPFMRSATMRPSSLSVTAGQSAASGASGRSRRSPKAPSSPESATSPQYLSTTAAASGSGLSRGHPRPRSSTSVRTPNRRLVHAKTLTSIRGESPARAGRPGSRTLGVTGGGAPRSRSRVSTSTFKDPAGSARRFIEMDKLLSSKVWSVSSDWNKLAIAVVEVVDLAIGSPDALGDKQMQKQLVASWNIVLQRSESLLLQQAAEQLQRMFYFNRHGAALPLGAGGPGFQPDHDDLGTRPTFVENNRFLYVELMERLVEVCLSRQSAQHGEAMKQLVWFHLPDYSKYSRKVLGQVLRLAKDAAGADGPRHSLALFTSLQYLVKWQTSKDVWEEKPEQRPTSFFDKISQAVTNAQAPGRSASSTFANTFADLKRAVNHELFELSDGEFGSLCDRPEALEDLAEQLGLLPEDAPMF